MRPGCDDAHTRRMVEREQQALLITDAIIAVCLLAAIAAVYVGLFQ